MAKKKNKFTLGKSLLNIALGIPSFLSLTAKIASLFKFEAGLASRSVVNIIMLGVLFALLLSASWICLLALLFVHLMTLGWSIPNILLTLLGINLFSLSIVGIFILKYKKRLSFPETRFLVAEARNIFDEL
jgi:hypothetical protein